ncbi:MAG: hypothetical protein KAJ49_11245 [Arcobacteraceae bacterium]|nr:hypothetical protein [Arcobacteraceae bacterium]
MTQEPIINQILIILDDIEEQINNINDYHGTNYFTILGALRVVEKMLDFIEIENISIENKFNRLWNLNK